ncbi:ribonuclease H-like [Centruroides vittatus]|uniref:ribonuclease H-like n=1 Tax=Centruroides vittatus TaxID=120091 RepID=UPI0035108474
MAGLLPMDLEISQKRDIRKILKEKITYGAILTEKDEIEYQIKRYQQLKRYEWKKIQIKEYSPLTKNRIYTDGSRTPEGVEAAYIYISNNREQYNRKIKLDKRCNNYQAELVAIEQAVSWISNNMKNVTIAICTDSHSVLKALNDDENKHELVDDSRKNILANKNNISFGWVRAHMGDPGNERVDSLAKEASGSNIKVVYKKLSERYIKREIKNKYRL